MFGCCQDTRPVQQICRQTATYYEFTSPTTTQPILIPYIPNQPTPTYPNTRRIRVKCRDIDQITKQLTSVGLTNFIDEDFPHHISSLGKTYERAIVWLRVKDVVKNPVYILPSTLESWDKFRCSNKCLQSALYLLRVHHPQLFMKILIKQINDFGLYKFRLMVDGVVIEQIIDDYIPVSEGMPVYAKPYKGNQVFPLLIQKALAKVFGSYVQIPDCPLGIIETLAATPVASWNLRIKMSQEQLITMKRRIEIEDATTCFMPRQGSLLGEQGLNEGEPYLLTKIHEAVYSGKPIVLYEMTNLQSKSVWNGPFQQFDDQNWGKVQTQQASALKQRLHSRSCFMVEQSDVLKYFSTMSSVEKTNSRCIDWTTLSIHKNHGAFQTINIRAQTEKIFIKAWACEAVRQVFILARLKKNNECEFVQGAMIESSKSNFIKAELTSGVYVLFIKVQWKNREINQVYLGSCSKSPLEMISSAKTAYPEFLVSMFRRMALGTNPSKPQISNKNYSAFILYRQTGYAFVVLQADSNTPIIFKINEKALLQHGFKPRKPHAGKQFIEVSVGQPVILTFKMLNSKCEGDQLMFPEGCIRVQK